MGRTVVSMEELTFSLDVLPRLCKEGDSVVREYAEILRMGEPDGSAMGLPVVFADGEAHWVADGDKRLHAMQKIGISSPAVDIKRGSKADAIWYAIAANKEHGVRLTNEQKRRAVQNAVTNMGVRDAYTNRAIAEQVGVSHEMVNQIVKKLTPDGDSPPSSASTDKGLATVANPLAEAGIMATEEDDKSGAVAQGHKLLNGLGRWVKRVVDSDLLKGKELTDFQTSLDSVRAPLKAALRRLT